MTVSTTHTYDPFAPDGIDLVFGFTFRCDDEAWIYALLDNVTVGGFTVLLNLDQSSNPGGTVTFAVAPVGTLLIIGRRTILTQTTQYNPYGRFPAKSHEAAIDKLTLQVQDFAEIAGRTAQYPPGSNPALQVQEWPLYDANMLWAWDPAIVGKVVNVVNPAVATAASAAAALASQNAALVSETAAAASYDSFDDRYLGPKAADPALDNDGNALLNGALYWNTATNTFKVYNGAAWVTASTIALPLAVNQGGTGSVNATAARAALGAAALGANTFTDIQAIQSAAPNLTFLETGVTADNGRWDFAIDGEAWRLRAQNDSGSSATNVIIVQRTGTTVDSITLGGPLVSSSTFSSTKAAETGYTRVTPNMCRVNSLPTNTSLVRDTVTLVTGPFGAVGLILRLIPEALSANAIGERFCRITVYSDSGATTSISSAEVRAREEVAVVGERLGYNVSEVHVKCDSSAQVWVRFVDDIGNTGAASYSIVGYYD